VNADKSNIRLLALINAATLTFILSAAAQMMVVQSVSMIGQMQYSAFRQL
jgi:hypothetical protein